VAGPLRRERMAAQVRDELSDIVQHHIRDPRVGWVTITHVEMSPDLCHAKVFISVLGDEQARVKSMAVLERAMGFIRGELSHRLRIRQTPEIHFKPDDSLAKSQRVGDILRGLKIPPAPAADGEEGDTGDGGADDDAADDGGDDDGDENGDDDDGVAPGRAPGEEDS